MPLRGPVALKPAGVRPCLLRDPAWSRRGETFSDHQSLRTSRSRTSVAPDVASSAEAWRHHPALAPVLCVSPPPGAPVGSWRGEQDSNLRPPLWLWPLALCQLSYLPGWSGPIVRLVPTTRCTAILSALTVDPARAPHGSRTRSRRDSSRATHHRGVRPAGRSPLVAGPNQGGFVRRPGRWWRACRRWS